jgi:hypothetical protein
VKKFWGEIFEKNLEKIFWWDFAEISEIKILRKI